VIRARPLDMVGVMFTRTEANPEVIVLQDLEYGLGRKSLPNSATVQQSWVQMFEATYNFHVMNGFAFQLYFQPIMQSNLQRNKHDVDAMGLTLHVVM